MKIELSVDNAYVNKYCMDAQAESINGGDILDYFSTDELEELMGIWIKALKIGGKITLGGTDVFLLSKNAINRSKELIDINAILFKRDRPIKSITSIESTKEFLISLECEISNIEFDFNSCGYCVEAYKT